LLILFGDLRSGNVHKAQMILHRLALPYRRIDVAQSRGEPRTQRFLELNPMGKVPALLFENGDMLSESGAILYFFAVNTDLWPRDVRHQTEVLRWMFFEQYSHEPSLAVIRFLQHHDRSSTAAKRIEELKSKARHALDVMERQLQRNKWIAGETCSIADYALYPYTRLMNESGMNADGYPAVTGWLTQMEEEEGVLVMGKDGAVESIVFSDYEFG
jgi:glutathione S-transferase